jgi:hypothetical protein
MKFGLRAAALSAALCGGALSVSACADNESMLFIVGVLAIEETDCILSPQASAVLRTGGVLDMSLRSSYTAGLLVGSQLTQRGNRDQLRTETARLAMRGAEVRLETAEGNPIAEFTTISSGFVHPASGTDPGYGAISAELIPAGAPITPGVVVARISVFGDTLGGEEVQSNEFFFPITICSGCLVDYPAEASQPDQAPNVYLCDLQADMDAVSGDLACRTGQDVRVPCTACAAQNPICKDPCLNCSTLLGGLDCSGSPPANCP